VLERLKVLEENLAIGEVELEQGVQIRNVGLSFHLGINKHLVYAQLQSHSVTFE